MRWNTMVKKKSKGKLPGVEWKQEVLVRRKFVALDLDHQGGTLAYEEQLKVPLQLGASEKIAPEKAIKSLFSQLMHTFLWELQ